MRTSVSDPAFWDSLTDHFDAVLHQAACTDTTVTDRAFMWRENTGTFERLLAWAEKNGTDVIYASSAATYGNAPSPQTVGRDEHPLNVYGESKLAMDLLTRSKLDRTGIKIIGLRYFNVYGPGEAHKNHMASMIYKLAQQMKEGKRPRIFRDGTQKRDQVYVDDVVQANLRALDASKTTSGIYNVGTGAAVSFNDIIAELNRVLKTNLDPEYIENPYAFFQHHTEADISSTKEKLRYEPRYDLRRGIERYWRSGAL